VRDVMKLNLESRNFRLFGPDETASNRLQAVYSVTPKMWEAELRPDDENLSHDGRVMEVLSEHLCQGWLEGYLLTGRHGLFSCYSHRRLNIQPACQVVEDYARTDRVAELPADLPCVAAGPQRILTPGSWLHRSRDKQESRNCARALAPDANTLLSVTDRCLRSRNYVNVIVAGKQQDWQWLNMDAAIQHCTAGAGIWHWAGNDDGDPDVVMACAGDVPTLETLAAVSILRRNLPDLKVRVVNVVDLMTLQSASEHPHGLDDDSFDALFTTNKPVIFAYHGYPWLIHRLTYRRRNHDNIHVRGYKEEGTTTTPFDMAS